MAKKKDFADKHPFLSLFLFPFYIAAAVFTGGIAVVSFLASGIVKLIERIIKFRNDKRLSKNDSSDLSFYEQERNSELNYFAKRKAEIGTPSNILNLKTSQSKIDVAEDQYADKPVDLDFKEVQSDNITVDELLPDAVDIVMQLGFAATSMLQRRLRLGYSRASRILDQMEQLGIVGPFEGSHPRKLLITQEDWLNMRGEIKELPVFNSNEKAEIPSGPSAFDLMEEAARDYQNWMREMRGLTPLEDELRKIDSMDGHSFENWCADLLRHNGYTSVEVTRGSGDQGVDITAEKDGLKYAVQCKCYSSDLSNKPIQEVSAGKAFYRCNVGAVMTNRYFTSGAKELAEVNGILLWDRDTIIEMLKRELPENR